MTPSSRKRLFLSLSFLFSTSDTIAAQNAGSTSAAFINRARQPLFLSAGTATTQTEYVVPSMKQFITSSQLHMQATNHTSFGLKHRHSREPSSSSSSSSSSTSSTELSASFADVAASMAEFKVYCDLDGVLVDFEKGVRQLFQAPSSQLVKGTMWKQIARANAFYEHLDWTNDGKRLWEGIRHLRPDILTGVPYPKTSRVEKLKWCQRELGLPEVHHVDMAEGCRFHEPVNGNTPREDVTNVITCWSNNKYMECCSRSVLIDDRECMRDPWERAGGIFIHHVDAETTLQQLRDRGIL